MHSDIEVDYIVVGAGSAGCVLANRLSADGLHTVLLLEAGGDDRAFKQPRQFMSNLLVHTPIGFGKTLNDRKVNWLYQTEADLSSGGRTHKWPKGKVLGGSSSINGLLYVRGQALDYDEWAEMGCTGWSYEDVLPYFRRAQHQERGESEAHGVGGPINTSDFPSPYPVGKALLDACVSAGIPYTADINTPEQEGVGWFQFTIKNGRRCSAAVGYLHPVMSRKNLTVLTDALAKRVLFEGRDAVGLEYDWNGATRRAKARAEVILAAGSIESPKLLELSGIGQPELLQKLGIPLLQASLGVGENLQDHYMLGCQWSLRPGHFSINNLAHGLPLAKEIIKYAVTQKGLLSYGVAHLAAFARSRPELTRPDVQLHMMAASIDLKKLQDEQEFDLEQTPGVTCNPCQLRPESRGNSHASSPDFRVYPKIMANYLSHPADQRSAIDQLKLVRKVMTQPALAPFVSSTSDPFGQSDQEMLGYARMAGTTLYHPVGTCRMGSDSDSVVDPALRVRGTRRLRVVDASIMPRLTSGNTNAPTIMIAEKASDMILLSQRKRAIA